MRDYKLVNLSLLREYDKNSRTHSDTQIQQLCESIKEFGFTNPLLIDECNTIIAGHARKQAAQLLKLEQVPCVVLKDLTQAQKRALVIADNKLALNASWDNELLSSELKALSNDDFDLSKIGFSDTELLSIFDDDQPNFDDVEFDETKPKCKTCPSCGHQF